MGTSHSIARVECFDRIEIGLFNTRWTSQKQNKDYKIDRNKYLGC
jgi:hypothetical protein